MLERTMEPRRFKPLERRSLWVLVGFTAFALLGFATFGRNPALLARFPGLAGFYQAAFAFFAQGHIVVAAAALLAILVPRTGGVWVPAFVAVCGISLTAEWVGTSTGWPFGRYHYTELLGPQIGGQVPWLIPVSWYLMALPSFDLAERLGGGGRASRWLIGAALLTAWDLSLDPAMSHLSPYWVWDAEGSVYGMPLRNLAGWFGTGVVLMAGIEATGGRRVVASLPPGLMAAYYLAVLSLSFGMVLVAGLWISVLLSIPVLALIVTRGLAGGGGFPMGRPALDGKGSP